MIKFIIRIKNIYKPNLYYYFSTTSTCNKILPSRAPCSRLQDSGKRSSFFELVSLGSGNLARFLESICGIDSMISQSIAC